MTTERSNELAELPKTYRPPDFQILE